MFLMWFLNLQYTEESPKVFNRKRFSLIYGKFEKYIKMFIFSNFGGSRAIFTNIDLLSTSLWMIGKLFSATTSRTE